MSTAGRAPLRAVSSRRAPRCPLAVPVRVTILRSGAAYSIPGRSLDLSETGISAVLAGEVHLSDAVGMEFLLPDMGLGLQAKAVVRHYAPLRCGFEFQGLTRHQQAVIREWSRQRLQPGQSPAAASKPERPAAKLRLRQRVQRAITPRVKRILWMAAGILLIAGLASWWHWQQAWKDLEQQIQRPAGRAELRIRRESLWAAQLASPLLKSRPRAHAEMHLPPRC